MISPHRIVALLVSSCLLFGECVSADPADPRVPPADQKGDQLPNFAVARLGTVRWRHALRNGSGFATVVFSPDGKLLVSCGDMEGSRVWEAATGKQVPWFREGATTHAAVFSPDGKTLITEGERPKGMAGVNTPLRDPFQLNRLIQHWDVNTGKQLQVFEITRGRNFSDFPQFSPDGKLFFVNERGWVGDERDKTKVRIWDAATGKPLLEIAQSMDMWRPIMVAPDGKSIAIAGRDRDLGLYELPSGKLIRRLHCEDTNFFGVVISPDGKSLACSVPKSFRVWDLTSGKMKREVAGCWGPLAFSPDGRFLACGDEKAIRLWEWPDLKEVRRFDDHHDSLQVLTFSPDSKYIASGQTFTVGLWSVATGKQINFVPGHHGPPIRLVFSHDGMSLASGGNYDGTAYVWDLATRQARHRFTGHYIAPVSLAFSSDGKLLATGDGQPGYGRDSREAQIRLWDLEQGKLAHSFAGHLNSVYSLHFGSDGKTLASGGGDARFRLWEPRSGKRLAQLRGVDALKSVDISPDGKMLLLAGSTSELALWQPDMSKKLRDLGLDDERRHIVFAAFVQDGKAVCSVEHRGGRAIFWDPATGGMLRICTMTNSPLDGCVAVSPDGKLAAKAAPSHREGWIEVWDTEADRKLIDLPQQNVCALAFAPDGKTLASGNADTSILLWDVDAIKRGKKGEK